MGDKHRTTCRGRSSTLRSGRVLILDTAERVSQNQHNSDTSPPRGKKKQKTPNWQPSVLPHSLTWHRVRTVGRVPRRLEQTVEPPEALANAQAGWHTM